MVNLTATNHQNLPNITTYRTVKSVNGIYTNTETFSIRPTGSVNISQNITNNAAGDYSPAAYNTTQCYFLSRGASKMFADAMSALSLDMATLLGISIQSLLEQSESNGKIIFTDDAYREFNSLRGSSNQVGVVSTTNNRVSSQARQIRS